MPNRIIKESLLISDKIAALSDFEFRLWIGLIVSVDDAGRGDARPAILKGRVFPLRERISLKDIERAIHGLAAKGCVSLYEVDGKPYFWFPTWARHQRIRNGIIPKYPAPPENLDFAGSPQVAATRRDFPPESESESKSKSKSKSESKSESETEANASCAEPLCASTPAILLPLNDGTEFSVSQEQCQEWAGLYPAVDVIQQLRNMKGWLDSHPSRRKTRRGIKSFVTNWLAKEQNRGAPKQEGRPAKQSGESSNPFLRMLMEDGGET